MNPFTLLVSLASVLTACEGTSHIPGLVIRQTNSSTAGGFATRSTACLTNQVDCGGGVSQEICCPASTFCYNSDDGVCCATGEPLHFHILNYWLTSRRLISDVDCRDQFFAAPQVSIYTRQTTYIPEYCVVQCADPSWVLCTDYQPNIPTYSPNNPGYWCCPTSTQCLVTTEGGYVCSSVNNGAIPGLTVLSGQAPTQASTATTLPTVAGSATGGTSSTPFSPIPFWKMIEWTWPQKLRPPHHLLSMHRLLSTHHLLSMHHLLSRAQL